MNEFEDQCELNLAETCVSSFTVREFLELCGKADTFLEDLLPMHLTYGAIRGSDRLRSVISELYETQTPDNILVTHGTIGANALVHETLVSPGNRVISVQPTYQQHYAIPESYGADVQIFQLRPENNFLPDLDELRRLATRETELIAINNPNNPTGALMPEDMLGEIAEIARSCDAYVLSDEVYRGMDHHGDGFTASIADIYEKGISTAGMSKAFSLAGIRIGWIVAPLHVVEQVSIHRDYNTISVGMINDYMAAIALENREKILERSRRLVQTNLKVLSDWIDSETGISWVKPRSGTTAFIRYDLSLSSHDFCVQLLKETGVMLTPGSAFEMEGWLRIGYANQTAILTEGLDRLSSFLSSVRTS